MTQTYSLAPSFLGSLRIVSRSRICKTIRPSSGGNGDIWRGDAPQQQRRYRAYDSRRRDDGRALERPKRAYRRKEKGDIREGFDDIYGLAPVLNALVARRRPTFTELKVQDRSKSESRSSAKRSDANSASNKLAKIYNLANEMNIPVLTMDKHDMNMLSSNRPHQGVILTAGQLPLKHVDELPPYSNSDPKGSNVWLALDEVVDPQNLGALVRSASFLGASGVVICSKNSASLSPVVSKASAGALELATIHSTNNMPRFLKKCSDNGWRVVGTTLSARSIPLRDLSPARSRVTLGDGEMEDGEQGSARTIPTILVLGNEGHGLRTMVERACDTLVNIENRMNTFSASSDEVGDDSLEREAGIDSLNVAVSGGIVLHHLTS